ncbi:hypothetical protein M5238_002333 [Vibrio vulnificus]|nr:hypothetical protein [Vibrio vulnificus]
MEFLGKLKKDSRCELLTKSINSKKENVQVIRDIEKNLRLAYSRYDSIISKYNKEPQKTAFNLYSKALVNFYEYPPKDLSIFLKNRRKKHGLLECPFCGRPNHPTTLDHFIPKDFWPEYSIFPNNLVPQCHICAPTKGKKYFCENSNKPLFLHPIFHQSLSKIKFNIEINFNTTTKKHKFNISYSVPNLTLKNNLITERIKIHLKALNVHDNILLYCETNILEWESQLRKEKFNLKTALTVKLQQTPKELHGNNWETALYTALLATPEMITHMERHCPKPSSQQTPQLARTLISF